jgi:hypothetical protein
MIASGSTTHSRGTTMKSRHRDRDDKSDADPAANVERPQLLAAYRIGRALNHIQWLSRLTVIDALPFGSLADIESILDDVVPLTLEALPATGIHAVISQIDDARREWRDLLPSESFSDLVSVCHDEFHDGDDAAFRLLLNWAEKPWEELHASVLAALHDSPRLRLAVQLGVTVDQKDHTPDVVDDLLDRMLEENAPVAPQAARAGLGGKRANKPGRLSQFARASSVEGLPVPHGWSRSVRCLADRLEIPLGASLPVDDPVDEAASDSVVQTQTVDTAITAYLAAGILPRELPPPADPAGFETELQRKIIEEINADRRAGRKERNQKVIAAIVGCSRSTVSKVAKRFAHLLIPKSV